MASFMAKRTRVRVRVRVGTGIHSCMFATGVFNGPEYSATADHKAGTAP